MMHDLLNWISQYGIIVLVSIIFLESLGAPLPGETALIGSGILAANGQMSVIIMMVCAFLAAVFGDCAGYAIGHFGGRKLLTRFGGVLKLTPQRLHKFENALNCRGFYFVASARFIVVARQLNGVIAGSGGMAFLKFLPANIVGAALWVLVWGGGPFLIKKFWS